MNDFLVFLFFSIVERQKETVSEAADKVQKRKLGSFVCLDFVVTDCSTLN